MPVLNKMDLPQSDPERAKEEIEDVIGIDADRRHSLVRPRPAMGIDEILEAVVALMPARRKASPTPRCAP